MVVKLAHGPEAGDTSARASSMPFRDVSHSSSAFSTASDGPSSEFHHMNDSSSMFSSSTHRRKNGQETKRRSAFKGLVRVMGKLSSHHHARRDSLGAFTSRQRQNTHATDQRRRTALSSRRTRPFFSDPTTHLQQSLLTAEAAPFLHARISQMIPAQVYNLNDFDVSNKLLENGDFCETHAATFAKHYSSQSSTPQTRQQPYRIKVLQHTIYIGENDDEVMLERAATKMMIEGLYLAHLSHPGIVKLRGHNKEGLDSIKYERPEHFFFVTDHLGESLPQRLESWKRWATAREKEERRRRHRMKYPAPLVPNNRETPEASILKNKLIQTYPEDLIVLKVNYALQILNALQFIHERGIVVRELRPEAIAFCDYPHHHTIQLCDLTSCREIPRGSKYIPPEGEWKSILMKNNPSTRNLHLWADDISRSTHSHCSIEEMDNSTSKDCLSPVMEDDDTDDDNAQQQHPEPSHSDQSVEVVQRNNSKEEAEISFTSHENESGEMGKIESQPTHNHEEHESVEAQHSSTGISLHHLASGFSVVTDEVTHYQLSPELSPVMETDAFVSSQEDGGHENETKNTRRVTQILRHPMPDISEMSMSNQSDSSHEKSAKKAPAKEEPVPDASFPAALLHNLETVDETDESEQSFFEETGRSCEDPTKLKATGDNSEEKSTASTGSHSSSHQTNINAGIFEVRTSVEARRYLAPDIFTGIGGVGKFGYNAQADIYSWAMIFTELLTETRPYGARQIRSDWSRIVVGALRPNIKKYHFPRAVKCILEQAWQAHPEKRGSAAQLSKSLERVLVMLEGQQNPWDTTAGELSVPEEEQEQQQQRKSTTSKPLSQKLSLLKRSSEKDLEIVNQGPTLPERASKYKRWMAQQPQNWSNIWDPRSTRDAFAEQEALKAAVQGKKDDLFARKAKANPVNI